MLKLNQFYLGISCITVFLGMLFVAVQKEWIILRFSSSHIQINNKTNALSKRSVMIFFWHNQEWRSEKNLLIWSSDLATNVANLTQSWLTLLDEEKITRYKVNLESALINQNQQIVYLSFDRTLFTKEMSTHQKLMIIEGLLKTLRENQIKIPQVQFLVHHQPIKDGHLDFSQPWPISGFLI